MFARCYLWHLLVLVHLRKHQFSKRSTSGFFFVLFLLHEYIMCVHASIVLLIRRMLLYNCTPFMPSSFVLMMRYVCVHLCAIGNSPKIGMTWLSAFLTRCCLLSNHWDFCLMYNACITRANVNIQCAIIFHTHTHTHSIVVYGYDNIIIVICLCVWCKDHRLRLDSTEKLHTLNGLTNNRMTCQCNP